MISFCARCLYGSSHPLGLVIDQQGICSGCRVHEEKDELEWQARGNKLRSLVAPYRSSLGNYDCIVPVTASQDSYFTVWYVKEILQLNPLLVNYNTLWNSRLGIFNLANLRIKSNSDIIQMNVNPISVKKITKTTLRKIGSVYWHVLAGHTVHPVQTAIRKKIPLIIWGGHQGVEQVGMFSHEHEVEMTRHYRKMHDLMGHEADDLVSTSNLLSEADVWQYRYPSDSELYTLGVRGIYLSNYVRWDPSEQHRFMTKTWNYRSAKLARTFDTFDHIDSEVYMYIHDLLKLFKHGYSKVTDQASREIRFGRINRTQGLELVRRYEQRVVENVDLFAAWLGAEENSVRWVMNLHRNKKFWGGSQWENWTFSGWSKLQENPALLSDAIHSANIKELFPHSDTIDLDQASTFVTVGKGWGVPSGA